MRIKQVTEKRVLTILALMASCLLAGNALADDKGANKNADFGQNTAAAASEEGEAMKKAGKDAANDAANDAPDEMNEKKDKAARKAEKQERKARKKAKHAEEKASKNAEKAERKAKQAQKDTNDLKDTAVEDATDTSNEAKGALDGMTAPE